MTDSSSQSFICTGGDRGGLGSDSNGTHHCPAALLAYPVLEWPRWTSFLSYSEYRAVRCVCAFSEMTVPLVILRVTAAVCMVMSQCPRTPTEMLHCRYDG